MNARAEILYVDHGMPIADYHAHPALGSSGLRKIGRSPAHYFGTTLDPECPVEGPTAAQTAGTLAHCALLEPETLADRYAVRPRGLDLRTKEGKAWAGEINPRIEIVTAEQMRTAQRQAAAIRALPELGALLAAGEAEVSAFWIDEATGVQCKCRPDWVSPVGSEGVILFDLKTCPDASPRGFERSVWNWRYDIQAAFYREGWERATGQRVFGFVFGAVEHAYPHAAKPHMLNDDDLDAAAREVRRLRAIYAECVATGVWPGYGSEINILNRPAWATIPEAEEWQAA